MKDERRSVGVIGCGTVGGAIIAALEKSGEFQVLKNDKFKEGSEYVEISELKDCDLVFISVPTPFSEKLGYVDLGPVTSSTEALRDSGFKGILIIKSTIPPGTSRMLLDKCPDMKIVFNPEFLREKTAVKDFYNQKNIIMGIENIESKDFALIEEIFSHIVVDFEPGTGMIEYTDFETAELIKYSQNIMFASRVAICNIIYDACEKFNVEYDDVKELAFYREPTIGSSVVEVPGPDGLRGFGGKCLPKDLAGFNGFYEHEVLKAILKYNKELGRVIE